MKIRYEVDRFLYFCNLCINFADIKCVILSSLFDIIDVSFVWNNSSAWSKVTQCDSETFP